MEFLEVCWKSPGKFPDFCLLCSLKLGRQNTKHRLHTALLPPAPLPSPPRLLHRRPPPLSPRHRHSLCRVFGTAFVAFEPLPSPSLCCHHRAIATDTVVKSPPPPSSCRHRPHAAVPVESPTDAMVYHLPGGIICLDSSDTSIGSDVEEIVKWDDCLRKTETFSAAYLISLSLIDSRTSSVLRRFLQHAWSCNVQWIRVGATATAVLIKDIA